MKRCQNCGREREWLHKHHIVPKSQGGSDDSSNLLELCALCHEDVHGGPVGGVLQGRLAHSPSAQAKRGKTMARWWKDADYEAKQRDSHARAKQRKYGVPEIGYIEGRWCSIADACIACGGTSRPHLGHGLCSRCYQRDTWRKYQQGEGDLRKKNAVATVASILHILRDAPPGLTQTDIAQQLDRDTSTVSRYLSSLEASGIIRIDRDTQPPKYIIA